MIHERRLKIKPLKALHSDRFDWHWRIKTITNDNLYFILEHKTHRPLRDVRTTCFARHFPANSYETTGISINFT